MRNKKGQALVEFILILPIVLILIFTTVDIFNLILKKNELETEVSDQINLLTSNKINLETFKNSFNKDYEIVIKEDKEYLNINITKNYSWISPITKLLLEDNKISVKRVIPNETK